MVHPLALLDSDMLSEIMKGRDQRVLQNAGDYLREHQSLILDADILIAATALVHDLVLVTGNEDHFQRIQDLRFVNWRTASKD